jgi:hypothetical protein
MDPTIDLRIKTHDVGISPLQAESEVRIVEHNSSAK